MNFTLKKALTFFAVVISILVIYYVLASIASGNFNIAAWGEGARSWATGGLPCIIIFIAFYIFSDDD